MQYKLAVTLAVLCLLTTNEAHRILVSFPIAYKSHSILARGFVDRLLEDGHEVVHITSYPNDKPVRNLKEIDVSSAGAETREEMEKTGAFDIKNLIGIGNFGDSIFFTYYTYYIHQELLHHPGIVKLLNDPNEKFDAVIAEWFFSETFAGIAPLFQCPLIWFASTEPHWQVLRIIDDIPNPAYTVDLFADIKPPLGFWDRIYQLYKIVKKSVLLSVVSLFENRVYNSVFPKIATKRGVELPSFNDAKYNGSLMFINSHPSIGSPFRLPQNAVNIGGYHIKDIVEPLPTNIKKLMDGAKHGVVYFSMGTNAKSSGMSDNMKRKLLDVFGKLKETVIWKYEAELDNVPSNVHLLKWAPQQGILAHPNLKFFITHGGLLSTTEALYYGIPLIGLPVGADQIINMKTVEKKGFGIMVTLAEDMIGELTAAIQELLSNDKYKTRAKELSFIYHDRPLKPGAELVHWVDHVIKTKGAPHLRSPALNVPLYQKLYLDLLALITILISMLYLMRRILLKKSSKKTIEETKKQKKQ